MSSNQPSAGNINNKQGSSAPTLGDTEKAIALVLEGKECVGAYKYKEAIEKFSQAIALNPNPDLLCCRSITYCNLKQYDYAINDCQKAIELDPKCANAYLQLGFTFDGLKRYDEAIEAYKKALELDPGNERSLMGLAHVEEKHKTMRQESSPPTSEAISKANALKEQGNECMEASNFTEAVKKYTQAIAFKRDPVYYCNRAAAFCRLKKYDEAENDCRDAFSLDPEYAKAHGRIGFIFSCQGDYLAAYSAYKKALELDPNNSNYKENLALAESKVREANHPS